MVRSALSVEAGGLAVGVLGVPSCMAGRSAGAGAGPLAAGSVGAGAGATVAKAFGMGGAVKGGIGTARCALADGVSVGAAVAVNAWGGVADFRDGSMIAGPRRPDGRMADPVTVMLTGETAAETALLVNTTIGVVATDAALDKMQVNFVASSAHDGLALTIRPCHTPNDGDTMFSVATGRNPAAPDLMTIVAAATQVTALAVIDAVRSATGLAGVPAVSELNYGIG